MKNENKKIARLIKQIQRGNQSAFEEFYKLTSPKAYFIALKITQNEHDAEDILQESYIKALEKINEIDTSQNVNSWFLRIVSNKSKDLLKSRNHLVFDGEEESVFDEIPEEKAEFSPEENLNQEELRLEVMAAIDELTAEKRACIMMMYFGDMSVKEIAESIEVPESTVKNRLFTARKDLKARFEKNGNVLYGAALGGLLIWALSKTGETTASAFASSAASASVLAGVNASSAAAATAVSSSAAATTTGVAAKVAALSAAQKVAAGIAATAVIGGSTAGVATVAKKIVTSDEPTTYIEEVTTAPSQTEEYVFAVIPEETTTLPSSTVQITEPTATVKNESTTKRPSAASTTESAQTTKTAAATSTTKRTTTTRPTTTRRQTTTRPTTTKITTTTRPTTTRPTTTESTTEEETTTRPTTTQPTTTTTQPTTTEPTTQAPATVNVEVVDMNEEVVATLSFTVEADTEMTWEYLVAQIKAKGYEPKAGIYGDAVGAVAESGKTYSITAEL